jgi:hypothetical protein
VSVGFGKNKFYVDISNDTMCCEVSKAAAGDSTEVAIGPGTYTTLCFVLYAYPAPVYSFDVVKEIKRADREATIKYPWSPLRMVLLAALIVLFIISAASSNSNNNTPASSPGVVASSEQTPATTETPTTSQTETTEDDTASQTATTPKPLSDASRTIKSHLTLLSEGRYSEAFALMSETYRSANPGWTANREQGDPEIRIVTVGLPHYNDGGTAHVYVKFYARDRNPTHGSDTRCRLFKGAVDMVDHGGTWRYEPGGNALSGDVVSGSACHA